MKNSIYTILSLLFLTLGLQAQETEEYKEKYYTPDPAKFEQFVNQAYGDRAEELVFSRKTKKLILKDYLTNRIIIVDRNPELDIPAEHFQQLSNIGAFDYTTVPSLGGSINPDEFNPFYYKIDLYNTKEIQYIHITGTHFYVKIEPFDPEVINELR